MHGTFFFLKILMGGVKEKEKTGLLARGFFFFLFFPFFFFFFSSQEISHCHRTTSHLPLLRLLGEGLQSWRQIPNNALGLLFVIHSPGQNKQLKPYPT